MKNFRGFALGLVLGLAVAVAGVGFAQNPAPTDAGNKSESCCCMTSGCCKGDSCEMKDSAKHKSEKHECCCCGDSCEMKMKDMKMKDMKNMKHKP